MILELLAAGTVGITFANTWMCVLLSFGAGTEGQGASRYFIAGRFAGVVLIGMAVAILGVALQEFGNMVLAAFGVLSVVFALVILTRQLGPARDRAARDGRSEDGAEDSSGDHCSSCGVCGDRTDGRPAEPAGEGTEEGRWGRIRSLLGLGCGCGLFARPGHDCDHGPDRGPTAEGRGGAGGEATGVGERGRMYGLALGLFRGATPCAKILLLAPLLVVGPLHVSFMIILVYAATSTVYPVIGLLSARLLSDLRVHGRWIRAAGAMMILVIGIYTLARFLLWGGLGQCPGGGPG